MDPVNNSGSTKMPSRHPPVPPLPMPLPHPLFTLPFTFYASQHRGLIHSNEVASTAKEALRRFLGWGRSFRGHCGRYSASGRSIWSGVTFKPTFKWELTFAAIQSARVLPKQPVAVELVEDVAIYFAFCLWIKDRAGVGSTPIHTETTCHRVFRCPLPY